MPTYPEMIVWALALIGGWFVLWCGWATYWTVRGWKLRVFWADPEPGRRK